MNYIDETYAKSMRIRIIKNCLIKMVMFTTLIGKIMPLAPTNIIAIQCQNTVSICYFQICPEREEIGTI